MSNSPNKIDTPGEIADLISYLLVFTIVGMFIGGFILSWNPAIDDQIRANYFSNAPAQSGDQLVFSGEQIDLVSKAYREKDEEIGFCLRIEDDRVEEMKFSPNVTHSTEKSLRQECQVDTNGLIHTHPGYFSSPELSEVDKDVLRSGSMDVVCAVSEAIPVSEEKNPAQLRCLDSELERLETVIER